MTEGVLQQIAKLASEKAKLPELLKALEDPRPRQDRTSESRPHARKVELLIMTIIMIMITIIDNINY